MRVIALTSDPALTVALNMMDDWEVVQVTDAQGAVEKKGGAAALVIGAESTDAGLVAAESAFSQGLTLPVVIVGDAEGPAGARATVVSRPFSLDDLRDAVDRALKVTPGAGMLVEEQPAPAPAEDVEEHEPEPEAASLAVAPSPAAPGRESADGIDLAEVKVPEPVEEPEPERPSLQVAPEPVPEEDTAPAPAPAPPTHAPSDPPEPAQVKEWPPTPGAPPEFTPELPAKAPARRDGRTVAAVAEPEPARLKERRRGMFGRRGRPSPAEAGESLLQGKVHAAFGAVGAIQDLLDELPILGDLKGISVAILGEVVKMFRPQVASIYVRSGDRFSITASHGLSKVEKKMTLQADHGLLAELSRKGDAMLIAPVDLAQGLVAGVAGTHAEALLAAPMMVKRSCVACVVIGRKDFDDSDLEALDALAREAAPGIGIARLLSELSHLAGG